MRAAFPVLRQLNAASLVTSCSVLLGAGACQLALAHHVGWAVLCGALAIPCDVIDGKVARRLGQVSAFGGHLDTLADAVSFCLVPAMIAAALGMRGLWTVALWAYPLCGFWRLARFGEVGTRTVNGRECFEGLPTAYAAALFYLLAAVLSKVTPGVRSAALGGFLLVSSVAMIGGFAFPKRGLHTQVLWFLVPVAVVACVVRGW